MGWQHTWDVLRRHPRPLRLIAARLLTSTGLSRLLTIGLDGYRLRFYPTNVSANLWITGDGRAHGLDLFKDYCRSGDVAVDVGANIGEVAIILSRRVGETGRVFAFEPNPRVYRFLLGNLALNGCRNVTPINLAVGARAGTVRMSNDKVDDMNRVVDDGTMEVPSTTLDARELPDRIAFLKVDVEGSELRVLEGAQRVLARTQCVNCEMRGDFYRRYGYDTSDVIGFLRTGGFQTFVIDGTRALRRIDDRFNADGGHELVALRDVDDFIRRTGWTVA